MQNVILHLDMNSYFASVEQQANPLLRGRPVGVCEHLGGIIIAPSVEAKRAGIKLGTPVWEAIPKCPAIVLLPTDPDKYRAVTERFNRILRDYADEIERYSIDESFADITECCGGDWDGALLLGLEIKQRLRREVGEWVSCSIGIGPNKLVAKIAADLDGGDGGLKTSATSAGGVAETFRFPLDRICVIKPEDVPLLYDRLKLTDIPGIGRRLERSLNKLGIFTLRQLRDYPLGNLLNQFGIGGWVLHGLGHFGGDYSSSAAERSREAFSTSSNIKSVGHAYTLPRAIRIGGIGGIRGLMMKLCEKVGRRMRRKGARGNVVSYFHSGPFFPVIPALSRNLYKRGLDSGFRQNDKFIYFHQQRKLPDPICDGREIYRAAWGIYKSFSPSRREGGGKEGVRGENEAISTPSHSPPSHGGEVKLKIMGITVSGLVFSKPPEPLWPHFQKSLWATAAADKINDKYGDWTIYPGRLLGVPEEWGKDTIGLRRI